ncbi:MAG: response regulator [Phycisphaerae bacterium]|nr:response regulator [Phycisphaerae bacterium]
MSPIILIVEDVAIVRRPIEIVLRREGYEVLTAENGRDALEIMSTTTPDLVLLDLGLPILSGLDVLERMRATEVLRSVRVIIMSASNESEPIERAERCGVQGRLVKTHFSLAELRDVVRATLQPQSHAAP